MQINSDLTAVITGGASGLGEGVARHLAAKGVKVGLFDLNEERGESILSFAMKAAEGAEEQAQLSPEKLLQALLSGNSNGVKLEIIHALGKGDEQMGSLIGKSVVITDRNKKCFTVLDQEIKKGAKKVGIFYGAAHFPDMEKTLLSKGFTKQSHQWLTTWDIPKN